MPAFILLPAPIRFGALPGLLLIVAWCAPALAEVDETCALNLVLSGDDALTVAEIRQLCPPSEVASADPEVMPEVAPGGVDRRLESDRVAAVQPFTLMAHKPNYFMPVVYNERGWDPSLFQQASGNPDFRNESAEAQFQVSLKVPVMLDLLGDRMDIYAAYTNRSFWQVYNDEESQPFRETNHEPEIWAQFENDYSLFGFRNVVNSVGLIHQSNGRSGVLSRSWNRLFGNFVFQRRNIAFGFKPWIIIDDANENDDIEDYLGHGEFRIGWADDGHVLALMLRNQLESGFDRGAVEMSWSFPLFDYPYLKGYVQYFYGYGESLVDYDRKVNRLGVGISLTDWLD